MPRAAGLPFSGEGSFRLSPASFRQRFKLVQVHEQRPTNLAKEVREFLEASPFVKGRSRESGFRLKALLVPEGNQSFVHAVILSGLGFQVLGKDSTGWIFLGIQNGAEKAEA